MQFMGQRLPHSMRAASPMRNLDVTSLARQVQTCARLASATFYFFLAAAPRTGALVNAHVGARRVSSSRPYGCRGLVPSLQLGFLLHRWQTLVGLLQHLRLARCGFFVVTAPALARVGEALS